MQQMDCSSGGWLPDSQKDFACGPLQLHAFWHLMMKRHPRVSKILIACWISDWICPKPKL